jgi:hypothetical protein
MPNLNRKGPNGTGAMSGRGLGKCNVENKGKSDQEILSSRSATSLSQAANASMRQRNGMGNGNCKSGGRGNK